MKLILCFLLSAFCFCSQAAVLFDASNDILGTATNGLTVAQMPISVSAWIKPEGFSEGSAGGRNGMICETYRPSPDRGWTFIYTSQVTGGTTNGLLFGAFFGTSPVAKYSVANSVVSNMWNHVAATWDGSTSSNGVNLYVNGILVANQFPVEGSGAFVPTTNTTYCIGNRAATTHTLGGQLSEVAVWTNLLTATEIAVLARPRTARVPLMVRPAALVAYWPMDGGPEGLAVSPANCITDLSGRGNNASPTNAPAWKASPLSYP